MLRKYYKYILVVILPLVGFTFGRYSAPSKITEQHHYHDTVTEHHHYHETEKEVVKWRTNTVKHEYKTVIEHRFPDGTVVTKSTDDVNTNRNTEENKKDTKIEDKKDNKIEDKSSTDTKIVEYKKPDWHIGPSVDFNITRGFEPIYGAHVERRILGPIWLGVQGNTKGQVGVNASIEF